MKIEKEKKAIGSVGDYLNNLQTFPQLKHPEVVELFKKFESGGNVADRARKAPQLQIGRAHV